jgi:hypothetical protein
MFESAKRWALSVRGSDATVMADANRLIRQFGDAALHVASSMSAREDMGFLASPAVGHWSRVHAELARQRGGSQPALAA